MLRAMLLGLFLLASAGTLAELLLLEHFEDWEQWLPLGTLVLGFGSGLVAALRPDRRTLLVYRVVMALFLVAGVAGFYLHYTGNVEFELEMNPSAGGLGLVWEALTGATPALAPGSMLLLGALGLVFTYRHPALASRAAQTGRAGPRETSSRQGAGKAHGADDA